MSDVEVFPIVFSQIHVLKMKMQKFFKVYLIYVIAFGNLKKKFCSVLKNQFCTF